ncbi:MAG: hypothetical protein Q7R97_04070 [Candidatus Daviesbacteria bacterium]|nr:hypothetical protein [Candidatus Daviesbacteria bacterium]
MKLSQKFTTATTPSYEDLKPTINNYIDDLICDIKAKQKSENEIKKLKYPIYLDLFDRPVKFEKIGKEIVGISADGSKSPLPIYEAYYEGHKISEAEYEKLLHERQKVLRKNRKK